MRPVKSAANAMPGVIETLTGGFEQVNRVPWIVGLPIVIDVALWLAPPLTAGTVIHSFIGSLTGLYGTIAANGADPTTVDQARQALTELDTSAGSFNLLSLLVGGFAGVPSAHPVSVSTLGPQQLGSFGGLAGAVLLMILLGTLLGCLYFGVLGQQVRDGRVVGATLARRVGFYWLSVLAFLGIVIGISLVVAIPVSLAVGLIDLIAPGIGVVLMLLAVAGAEIVRVLAMIYLFFLVYAIVLSEAGPVRAAVNSTRVVASNFWSSVGFILVVIVISRGMQVVWSGLTGSAAGTFVGILGNAYVQTGLVAASMLYYQSRVSRLPAARGVLGRVTQA